MKVPDPDLRALTVTAFESLEAAIRTQLPLEGEALLSWTRELNPQRDPLDYFLRLQAFPLLTLPYWLGQSLERRPDPTFHGGLVSSSIHGYYFIRMVDNVMDGEGEEERRLLPALGFFHLRFHAPYTEHFSSGDPFWPYLSEVWSISADRTIHDGRLEEIDREEFEQTCGAKFCAAKIPVAAVCHRAGRLDLVEPWSRFIDTLGNWYQMRNDVYDWLKDPGLGLCTYILCEWRRRRLEGESLQSWFVREGFDWATSVLDGYMEELQALAPQLACPAVGDYLETRQEDASATARTVRAGLKSLDRMARAVSPNTN